MKKILVLNPNTSAEMTEDIRKTVEAVKSEGFSVTVACPDFGPQSLESFYDYTLAGFGLLRYLEQMEEEYDGVLIACFGDPALYAVKEKLDCPVLGIAEASIAAANLTGQKFSLLVALEKAVPMMRDMVGQYGMESRLACILPIGMSVLDVEQQKEAAQKRLTEVAREAASHGAEVLILGCAGMTGLAKAVEEEVGLPVLDPVKTGYALLEGLIRGGIRTSKAGLYQKPPCKEIKQDALLKG